MEYHILKYLIYILIIALVSCNKEIVLDIPTSDPEVVVDGWIEPNQFPIVYLTASMPFFSKVDSVAFFNSIVAIAKVTVSNGTESEILTLKKNTANYPPVYYEGTELLGKVGGIYKLTINYQGKEITATTTIPKPPQFNYLKYKLKNDSDSLGYIQFSFTDPIDEKNYYRVLVKRKNKDKRYKPSQVNTFDDQYFNGETFTHDLFKIPDNIAEYNPEDIYFLKGDTAYIKLCSIDNASYNFWNSFQGKTLNLTSFASSPNPLVSNVNGGNGIWCGYGTTYYSIIIK